MRYIIHVLLFFNFLSVAAKESSVGEIRWDAWSGGNVTDAVERTLGSEKYLDVSTIDTRKLNIHVHL